MTDLFAIACDLTDVPAHRREMQQAETDLRNEVAAENLRRRGFFQSLADPCPVIDLATKRAIR